MKNKESLIQLNIQNLTSLWQEASKYNKCFISTPLFNYSAIENRMWPNRLWFNSNLEQDAILQAKENVFSKFPNLIIPHWDISGNISNQLLEQNGFIKIFEQIGMSLKTNHLFEENTDVKMNLVSTQKDAILWSDLFKLSFGYLIHPEILMNTHKSINYYIASYQGKSIGTAITYKTGKVTGMHSVGIIPEARLKGFADKLMKILINIAIRDHSEYITLQASDMGKGLYLNLGFEEQFVIKNYALQQTAESINK